MRIVNLNTWIGGKLGAEMYSWLTEVSPDVLFLQEAFATTVQKAKDLTRLQYSEFAPAFLSKENEVVVEQGNAIVSRYQLINREVFFYDEPFRVRSEAQDKGDFTRVPRNLQHVTAVDGDRELNLFNTQGIWGFDGKDTERRLAMAQVIVDRVVGLDNVILAGDFNVNEGTQSIAMIGDALRDVFADTRTSSFNMRQKEDGGYGSAVVDFVFLSDDFVLKSFEQPDVDVSDHLPQVVDVNYS